jgi:DNA-binding Lrp family transcriptional regulator
MVYQLSDIESKMLAILQEGFPGSKTPYKDMAAKAGIETKQFLTVLKDWKQNGKLRRIGAFVNHFKVDLSCGAMVVWLVEPERVEQIGSILAGFHEVSHAYERQPADNWPYNIYTMVHAADIDQLQRVVKHMSRSCRVSNYRILMTEKELKKTPPTYVKTSGDSG